jgi:hypothetical protein
MKTKIIEIQVHGFTGDGKTHVCHVIKNALLNAYGHDTQIASRVITQEANPLNKPSDAVVFSIEEFNHGAFGTFDV